MSKKIKELVGLIAYLEAELKVESREEESPEEFLIHQEDLEDKVAYLREIGWEMNLGM